MPVLRFVRVTLVAAVGALAVFAATASATPRMMVGFYDDPSFRWSNTAANLEAARSANASVIHTTADWSQIAPKRPANPLNGDDPAYRLGDLDSLVRDAPKYGLQVFVNISGAPKWANGGKKPNVPPKNLADLTKFSQMLAKRYNGTTAGLGYVARWSVWNEPNLELFLTPQFKGDKIVSPGIYAKIYAAAYKGIKAGNSLAQVAIGETSNRGRDKPLKGVSGSVAPGTFAQLLAKAAPTLKFDAWATHPYPTIPSLGPTQKVRYPNVTMAQLPNFEKTLRSGFKRRVPIWITEYGQQTKPELPQGVTRAKQSVFAKQAMQMAARNPDVEMFLWFILRDGTTTWKSGLLTKTGAKKPAYSAFASTARLIDGQPLTVKGGKKPTIKLYAPFMAYQNGVGASIGMTYRVLEKNTVIAIGQPAPALGRDQSLSFVADFVPKKGNRYTIVADLNDVSGNATQKTLTVLAS
jgi:hypothetical protein